MKMFNRPGQSAVTGANAVAKAAKVENRQTDGQNSLQVGDVIKMPATKEEFDEQFFAQNLGGETPACGIVVEVMRGSKPIAIRLYGSQFTRRTRLYKQTEETNEWLPVGEFTDDDAVAQPQGQPAEDVRAIRGSIYEAMSVLIGKTINVTGRDRVDTMRIVNGTHKDADGNEVRNQRISKQTVLSFEYAEAV